MAKKRTSDKPERVMTKRQLSHHKRELRRQRVIRTAGILVVAAVILIVLVGWYIGEYRPMHQTVLKVGDTEFNMAYYIDTLKLAKQAQPDQTLENIAGDVSASIARNELITKGALTLGLSVTDEEVKKALEGADIDLNDATIDVVRSQMLGKMLHEQYFDPQVPDSMSQANIRAMMLEDEATAVELRERLLASDNFSALAEEYSLDSYTQVNKGEVGWHPEEILVEMLGSSVPGAYAFGSEAGTLSQPRFDKESSKPVGYWLINVLDKQFEDEAQVQGLLMGSLSEAEDVRARLAAGENVTALAKEFSQHLSSAKNGGEMGLIAEGTTSDVIDGYVFSPDLVIGEWSQPLRDERVVTLGTWWLVEVLDKEDDRQLSDEDRNFLANKLSGEWLDMIFQAAEGSITDLMDTDLQAWAVERAARG